jgi:hypothetical protein
MGDAETGVEGVVPWLMMAWTGSGKGAETKVVSAVTGGGVCMPDSRRRPRGAPAVAADGGGLSLSRFVRIGLDVQHGRSPALHDPAD